MNKQKLSIVLFDMDGTLTEARRPIGMPMIRALRELFDQNERAQIGVVTGSDLNYIKQQMKPLFEKDYNLAKLIHWMPCNGTKYYKFEGTGWKVLHSVDMRTHLGEQQFRNILKELCDQQEHISSNRIPLTGHFIDYRGSMINWCPVGRNANEQDRKTFIEMDKDTNPGTMRNNYLLRLKRNLSFTKVTCKLGGDTSFDIYPNGWDKTYCLKYFENHNVYFVGDRCSPDGNDYELYNAHGVIGWQTKDPDETIKIMKRNITPLIPN